MTISGVGGGLSQADVDARVTAVATPLVTTHAQLIVPPYFAMRSGRYIANTHGGATATGGILAAGIDTLYAAPLFLQRATTIDRLAIQVTVAVAASTVRVGIYADNGAGYPGALVAGTDVAALSSAAVAVVENVLANVVLPAGLYWVALVVSAAGVSFTGMAGSSLWGLLGSGAGGQDLGVRWNVAFAFAALPANYPAGAASNSGTSATVWARVV